MVHRVLVRSQSFEHVNLACFASSLKANLNRRLAFRRLGVKPQATAAQFSVSSSGLRYLFHPDWAGALYNYQPSAWEACFGARNQEINRAEVLRLSVSTQKHRFGNCSNGSANLQPDGHSHSQWRAFE